MTTLTAASLATTPRLKGYVLIQNGKAEQKRVDLPLPGDELTPKTLTVGSGEGSDIQIPSIGETQGVFIPTRFGVKYSTTRGNIFTARIWGVGVGILNATMHPGQTIEFPDGHKVTVEAKY